MKRKNRNNSMACLLYFARQNQLNFNAYFDVIKQKLIMYNYFLTKEKDVPERTPKLSRPKSLTNNNYN